MTDSTPTPFQFTYPKNAREFPKRPSPLVAWYGNAAPAGCYVSDAGVVTSTNAKP
jgi:hypothetical protein